jgi:hypothetical protein
MSETEIITLTDEIVMTKIFLIRGVKVMLDKDLAELYEIETKHLKRQVKRNSERFPLDFMFELTDIEFETLRYQIGTSKTEKGGNRYNPMVFSEHGVLMLSSVLNSQKAVQVNIQIMRIFTRIRQMLSDNTELRLFIEELRKKTDNNTKNIELVFQYLDELSEKKEKKPSQNTIGFK